MRNFSIDLIWAKIQIAITAIGGWLGYFLGGIDGLMIALLIFMTLDYITGVMCAIVDKKLSSAVGFKGVCKKVLIGEGRIDSVRHDDSSNHEKRAAAYSPSPWSVCLPSFSSRLCSCSRTAFSLSGIGRPM